VKCTTKELTEPLFKLAARTPFNIAPERGEELANEIFGSGKWEIRSTAAAASFAAIPSENAIYLSSAGLASLWCLAFAAYHVMDIASRLQRTPKIAGQTQIDITEQCEKLRIAEHLKYAEDLFRADQSWPCELSSPQSTANFSSAEGRVNNVFFGALSWIMLHEIAHIHRGDDKFIPFYLANHQEYRADRFATEWVLDDAGSGLRREFRVLMVCVALAWLFINERVLGRGTDHPPAILRFREAANLFQMGDRSAALENAAYVFKALLDPATQAPPQETPQQSFEWISQRLECLFPAN
jgi:Peptidase U49